MTEGAEMIVRISPGDFRKGYLEFQKQVPRDSMYKTASFLVQHFWGKPADMADGMGVLLLTWNQSFYRYGAFDFARLEAVLKKNMRRLNALRSRDIGTLCRHDEGVVKRLFAEFLDALQRAEGKKKGTKSPVAVAKALHLLAPGFMPLWDDKIARAYDCYYSRTPAEKYLEFAYAMKDLAAALAPRVPSGRGKTFLKLIDEYNYAKFTKGWT